MSQVEGIGRSLQSCYSRSHSSHSLGLALVSPGRVRGTREASKLRIAVLRPDKARRSYGSSAASSETICLKGRKLSSLSGGMGRAVGGRWSQRRCDFSGVDVTVFRVVRPLARPSNRPMNDPAWSTRRRAPNEGRHRDCRGWHRSRCGAAASPQSLGSSGADPALVFILRESLQKKLEGARARAPFVRPRRYVNYLM